MRIDVQCWSRRRAFTLTEILAVIGIIAVLAALGAWAMFATINVQHRRNSENTIRVLNKMLQDRWSAVVADAKKETPSAAVLALAEGDNERAKVIWIKVRLMEAFPVSYAEVNNPAVLSAWILPDQKFKPHFARYKSALAGKIGGPLAPGESSACLLLALKTLQADGVAVDDQLTYAVAQTDGVNAIPTLVDGWSKPLVFSRFATGAPNPATAGAPTERFADPSDPEGALLNPSWYGSTTIFLAPNLTARQVFDLQFHPISANGVNANYVIPVIVSAGRDNVVNTPDDIISYNLRGD